jgi:hypothetical protein
MITKYAPKPNLNPNEPIKAICGKLGVIYRTNPIFLRPIMDFYAKNAEMEAKNLPKKTKQTHLWITFHVRLRLATWILCGCVGRQFTHGCLTA